ncbi:MAG: methyltransferase domain-containing protein, partial [Desulfarculaceae bacterium]
ITLAKAISSLYPCKKLPVFITASLTEIPFPENYFDAIFCYGVLMLVPADQTMREFKRVLKPGGDLIMHLTSLDWYLTDFFKRGLLENNINHVAFAYSQIINWHKNTQGMLHDQPAKMAYTQENIKALCLRHEFSDPEIDPFKLDKGIIHDLPFGYHKNLVIRSRSQKDKIKKDHQPGFLGWWEEKKYPQIINHFNAGNQPTSEPELLALAKSFDSLGQFQQALSCYQGIPGFKQKAGILELMGICCHNLNQEPNALEFFEAAWKLKPSLISALGIIAVLAMTGRKNEADRVASQFLAQHQGPEVQALATQLRKPDASAPAQKEPGSQVSTAKLYNDTVYFALNYQTTSIYPAQSTPSAPPLPQQLLIHPGQYSFNGNTYNLDKEGLYRFIDQHRHGVQKIVYKNQLDPLLSSLAWITSHGNEDDKLNLEQLLLKASQHKLVLTCGYNSFFACQILNSLGHKAISVAGAAISPENQLRSHTLLEVYKADLNKWVMYDLDLKVTVERNGTPLSFSELLPSLNKEEPLDFQRFTAATIMAFPLDPSTEKTSAFNILFSERLNTSAGVRSFYEENLKIPLFFDNNQGKWVFTDQKNKQRLLELNPNYSFMDQAEFKKRFDRDPLDSYQ